MSTDPGAIPPDDTDDDPGPILRCWCGAEGTYDELFDDDGLDASCGGTGHVDCHCGGDLCVCHHHGQEVECPGCDECPERDGDYDGWDDLDPEDIE